MQIKSTLQKSKNVKKDMIHQYLTIQKKDQDTIEKNKNQHHLMNNQGRASVDVKIQ